MSRLDSGNVLTVRPTNNIYTALAAIATVVTILGVVVLVMRASELGIDLLSK